MEMTFKEAINEMAGNARTSRDVIGGIARIVTDFQEKRVIEQPKIQMQCMCGESFSGKILYRHRGEETMNEVEINVKFEAA